MTDHSELMAPGSSVVSSGFQGAIGDLTHNDGAALGGPDRIWSLMRRARRFAEYRE
jgi:hypothetical protein